MSVPVRLAAFGVALVLSFGGAYAVGAAVGPVDPTPTTTMPPMTTVPGSAHAGEHGS